MSEPIERPVFVVLDSVRDYIAANRQYPPSWKKPGEYRWYRSLLNKWLRQERGNACEECGRAGEGCDLFVHHKVSILDGGGDDDANLLLLCHECHQAKHEFPISHRTVSRR